MRQRIGYQPVEIRWRDGEGILHKRLGFKPIDKIVEPLIEDSLIPLEEVPTMKDLPPLNASGRLWSKERGR